MAFIISSKFPVDTLPDVAVGVSIPFSEAISDQGLEGLEAQIRDQLGILFPTVNVQELNVDSIPDKHQIKVTLKYQVLNQSLDEIQINFNNDGV